LAGLQNGAYKYCSVLCFNYFRKIAQWMLPTHLFILLRSHHRLTTDVILCYECPSSLSSFMNKSQIQLRLELCRQIRPNLAPGGFTKPEFGTALFTALVSDCVCAKFCNLKHLNDMAN